MRVAMQRALRALACSEKNQFFYNLNVQAERPAATADRERKLRAGGSG